MEADNDNKLSKAWRGETSAYKVFWDYAFPFNVAFFGTGFIAGYFAANYPWLAYIAFIAGPLYLLFLIWFCVSLWRCAHNVEWRGWTYVCRAWVLLTAGTLVHKLAPLYKLFVVH